MTADCPDVARRRGIVSAPPFCVIGNVRKSASAWPARALRSVRLPAIALAVAGTAACQSGTVDVPTEPDGIRLEHVLSSDQVPYSQTDEFAVLGGNELCMFDSYNVALLCGDRYWRNVSTVASEGSGPGEVLPHGGLLSAPHDGFAYLDRGNGRMSFFSTDGIYAGSATRLPGAIGNDIGTDSIVAVFAQPIPSTRPTQRMFRVNAFSGVATDTVRLRFNPGLVGMDTAIIIDGLLAPDGRILARINSGGEGWLAWYAPDGEFTQLLDFPAFGPVYPSERDIEEHTAGYRLIFGRPPPEADIRRFAERPLGRLPRGSVHRTVQLDSEGRAWVVTTRPSELGSHIEIFEGSKHLGTLAVPGRLRGIQIVDSTLVAMVDAMEPDADGLYPRRFDWYRIVSARPARTGQE
jgi:hypothetical protein